MFKKNRIRTIIDFSSYKLKFVLIRMAIVVSVASILHWVSILIVDTTVFDINPLVVSTIISISSILITEFNLFIIYCISKTKLFRWNLIMQFVLLNAISITFMWGIILIVKIILQSDKFLELPNTKLIIAFGGVFILIINCIAVIIRLTKEWLDSQEEIDGLKLAKLQSDYDSLQDRLNPHFLFNNLSVLKSMIRFDPKGAEVFTQNFTEVYRYLLSSNQNRTISVKDEMKFVSSYIALHKERLGDGVEISIMDSGVDGKIPPMSIQLLVENAIKHNIVSRSNPLKVDLTIQKNTIVVKNRIDRKETTYSSKTGLSTLSMQYKLISDQDIVVSDDGEFFTVTIPILN